MKKITTLLLILIALTASAQWSNQSNLFTDSLHMPVCTAAQAQLNPIMLRSYPDGGYFLIWEDDRNLATTKRDIYAQKYDAQGNQLWAVDGLPVANGPNDQHYAFSSNQDYRNRSFAATDSANGFYICYTDDSISTYDWQRITIQHMHADGSQAFPGAGYVMVSTQINQTNNYSMPFLLPDGNKGFYLSYKNSFYGDEIYVYDYRDDNGVLTSFGGGRTTDNATQESRLNVCGLQYYMNFPGITVNDYNIWSDGQGGCNVIMAMSGNGEQGQMLGYNRVWRAKKTSVSKHYVRNEMGAPCPVIDSFKQGMCYLLYTLQFDNIVTTCSKTDNNIVTAYAVTSMVQRSNGFITIDNGALDYNFPKGLLLPTSGNINVNMIAVTRRSISGNNISDFSVMGYAMPEEIFDTVPYERSSFTNPGIGYNPTPPKGMNTLTAFRDTLLASQNVYGYPDFSLAAGGTNLYAATLMGPAAGNRLVLLQHLALSKHTATSFSLNYVTPKKGAVIGSELNTGFTGSDIHYDLPMVSVADDGFSLFSVRDVGRGTARVSPIFGDAKLSWGAMGRPIGTGYYNGSYYDAISPVAMMDAVGSAVIGWSDTRNLPGNSSNNIFMRHIDSAADDEYTPPILPLKTLSTPYGAAASQPVVLTGTSDAYTVIAAPVGDGSSTPVAEILDDYDLGNVQVSVNQNGTGVVRNYNGQPYLDRNYTITVENKPSGNQIHVRLFFTNQDFSALQAADPLIKTPGDLVVVKQTASSNIAPFNYMPVAGEIIVHPIGWGVLTGGYYIEIVVTDFSNFYIERGLAALPLTWLGVQAQWLNTQHATVSWQIAEQQNVQSYTVQESKDGASFTDICAVMATTANNYSCTVPATATVTHYYRVKERDADGKFTYSKTVVLAPSAKAALALYPNPVKDKLYVTGLTGYNSMQVSDANGQLLQQVMVTGSNSFIDISRLRAGVYLLTIKGDKDTQTMKFVKQ